MAKYEKKVVLKFTPLMYTAGDGHCALVKMLIRLGEDVNAVATVNINPKKGELQRIPQPNIWKHTSSLGNTALFFAAAGGRLDIVKCLIDAGANVNHRNKGGITSLYFAVKSGNFETVKFLIDSEAAFMDKPSMRAMINCACRSGSLPLVKLLLENIYSIDRKYEVIESALNETIDSGMDNILKYFLKFGIRIPKRLPACGQTPLTLAAKRGYLELASIFIQQGADINNKNSRGYTPLMEAAVNGHEDLVDFLLSNNADVDAHTEDPVETALTLACSANLFDIVTSLVTAGADIELGTATPLMKAVKNGNHDIIEYLIKHGADCEWYEDW